MGAVSKGSGEVCAIASGFSNAGGESCGSSRDYLSPNINLAWSASPCNSEVICQNHVMLYIDPPKQA